MKIKEIFTSINGECNAFGQGSISTFIRFAGCNLSCDYCDVVDVEEGSLMRFVDIPKIKTDIITITGGEPFLQKQKLEALIMFFLEKEKKIVIETNGSVPIIYFSEWVRKDQISYVIDFKSSDLFLVDIRYLAKYDFIKFIVKDLDDLYAKQDWIHYIHDVNPFVNIIISPIHGELEPLIICDWLQANKYYFVQLNIQLHKYINMK